MLSDTKRAKKSDGLTVYFALLGFVCVKAFRKILVKLTPANAHLVFALAGWLVLRANHAGRFYYLRRKK